MYPKRRFSLRMLTEPRYHILSVNIIIISIYKNSLYIILEDLVTTQWKCSMYRSPTLFSTIPCASISLCLNACLHSLAIKFVLEVQCYFATQGDSIAPSLLFRNFRIRNRYVQLKKK